MKTPSNKLFLLIQKMTPSEKRYFKRFGLVQQKNTSAAEDVRKQYVLVFDAINEQSEYNEAILIEQFQAHSFVKNFSEIKKYLFQQILKALRNYHAQHSIDSQLYNYLNDINILYQKELYRECERIIAKAKKIAQRYEKFTVLLLLNEWKRNVLRISHHIKGMQHYLEQESKKDDYYIKAMQNETAYFKEGVSISFQMRQKGPNATLHKNTNLPSEGPITFRAKRYFFLKQSAEGYIEYNSDKVFKASCDDIALLESNPHFIEYSPKQYLIALANILDCCANKIDYNQDFDAYFQKTIDTLNHKKFDDEFRATERLWAYLSRVKAYGWRQNNDCELGKAREALVQLYQKVKRRNYNTRGLDVYVQDSLLRSAIILSKFSEALEAYNDFLELNLGNYREDLQMETRLLGLIPHYEFGNWQLLDSLIRSAHRLIERKYPHFQLGRLFVKAVKTCVALQKVQTPPEEMVLVWRKIKKDALSIANKQRLADYIIFTGWIDYQIKGGSVAERVYEVTQTGYRF